MTLYGHAICMPICCHIPMIKKKAIYANSYFKRILVMVESSLDHDLILRILVMVESSLDQDLIQLLYE